MLKFTVFYYEEAPTLDEFDALVEVHNYKDTRSLDRNCGFSLGYY